MRDAKQVQTGFVETNGTRLYYEMMGEGQPLVLLHGGYMDRRMWDGQFATFAQYYRVVHYDIRGSGSSDLPQVPYSDRQDLYDLLTYLDIEKTYLLGLSLGGGIAIDFTLEHPERVDALVLVGSSVNGARSPASYPGGGSGTETGTTTNAGSDEHARYPYHSGCRNESSDSRSFK